jgi:hypothetical protein
MDTKKRFYAVVEKVLDKYRTLGIAKAQAENKQYFPPVLVADFILKLVQRHEKESGISSALPASSEEFIALLSQAPSLIRSGTVKRKGKKVDAFNLLV